MSNAKNELIDLLRTNQPVHYNDKKVVDIENDQVIVMASYPDRSHHSVAWPNALLVKLNNGSHTLVVR